MPERLQKILARHGLGSRREIERFIAEGRVTVNHQLAKVGNQFHEGDRVAIDGKEITARLVIELPMQALMFHKTQGQSIAHGDGRDDADLESEAVIDKLPALRGSRWVPINPMHGGDSGLLLFTNDGNLGYALTRRKRWIPTAYMVRVLAPGSSETPPEIPPHVTYEDEQLEFSKVEPAGGEGANLWYRVELPRADRRAAVRALFESRNLKVSRMIQVSFGHLELPRDLPRGRHRALSAEQMTALYELAQIKMPEPPAPKAMRDGPLKHRSIAPDRRRASKKQFAAGRNDKKIAGESKGEYKSESRGESRQDGKRVSFKGAVGNKAVAKHASTRRIGGNRRPFGDSRR